MLNEDQIYQSSTQYRLWSFTPESLASIRAQTNAAASNAVKAALASKLQSNGAKGSGHTGELQVNVDCLTVDEELKLVGHYCVKTMELSDFCDFPTNVKVGRPSTLEAIWCLLGCSGYGCSIHEKILCVQLPDDVSSERDHALRPLPQYKDREPFHKTIYLCFKAAQDITRRYHSS